MSVAETQVTMTVEEEMAGYMRTATVEIWEWYKWRQWRHRRDAGTQRQTAAKESGRWKKM